MTRTKISFSSVFVLVIVPPATHKNFVLVIVPPVENRNNKTNTEEKQ